MLLRSGASPELAELFTRAQLNGQAMPPIDPKDAAKLSRTAQKDIVSAKCAKRVVC